jgi:uncharacterized Tic20 family protein
VFGLAVLNQAVINNHQGKSMTDFGISPNKDSKNLAAITHIASIFFAFFAPLLMYILKSDDAFIKETAKEGLNFAITVLLVYILLGVTIIGVSLMPVLWLITVVLYVIAAKTATEGQVYRFPFTWRLIK